MEGGMREKAREAIEINSKNGNRVTDSIAYCRWDK